MYGADGEEYDDDDDIDLSSLTPEELQALRAQITDSSIEQSVKAYILAEANFDFNKFLKDLQNKASGFYNKAKGQVESKLQGVIGNVQDDISKQISNSVNSIKDKVSQDIAK